MEVPSLILFLVVCLGAGFLGGKVTAASVRTWYPTLRKPKLNPPAWVFMPVWTTLYVMMAVAGWLIWREGDFWGLAGVLFGLQLVLNVLWSFLFFGSRRPDWALVDIGLMWVAIVGTVWVFADSSSWAAWLLVPYLVWVSFATYLNWGIVRLNPRVVPSGATSDRD